MGPEVIREFFSALVSRDTYDPRKNVYILFGLLWGLPVPIVGVLIHLQVAAEAGLAHTVADVVGSPLHIFLALHPLFFAVVFGALGTIRLRKTSRIQALLDRLAEEVERLARANTDLLELDRLKDEFLGNVTHELKTPLVTIRGYADMLRRERLGPLTESQRKAVSVTRRNAMRLQEQIDRLLACSRNQEQLQKLEPRELRLAALVAEVLERHGPVAESKGVELTAELPAGPVRLLGDRQRLMEVFDNLVSNAIKFTDAEGQVRISFAEPGRLRPDRIEGSVSDTGCGIAPEAHAFVFDRFRQADGTIRRQYGGSGLGLAIARSNLVAHGCNIKVESSRGEGATFIFDLPLAREAEEQWTASPGVEGAGAEAGAEGGVDAPPGLGGVVGGRECRVPGTASEDVRDGGRE